MNQSEEIEDYFSLIKKIEEYKSPHYGLVDIENAKNFLNKLMSKNTKLPKFTAEFGVRFSWYDSVTGLYLDMSFYLERFSYFFKDIDGTSEEIEDEVENQAAFKEVFESIIYLINQERPWGVGRLSSELVI